LKLLVVCPVVLLEPLHCGCMQADIYHTDEKWQDGQSYGKPAMERWSLFNEQ